MPAPPRRSLDPGDVTIATYGQIAEAYAERNHTRPRAVVEFLGRFAAALTLPATVLEIGSGPGDDADLLEREHHGLTVQRTDATPAFVHRLRAAGHDARELDGRRDPLGGPHDAVLANAVLLHLPVTDFATVIARIHAATRPGGILALTLKEGDGHQLTSAKVGAPRWFTYWREPALRTALTEAGWIVAEVVHHHAADTGEDWLHVIALRPAA